MKKFSARYIFTVFALLLSVAVSAQPTEWYQSFKNCYTGSSNYVLMNTLQRFIDWEFNEYCYAMRNDCMVVGGGTTNYLGKVTTSAIGIRGNATLLIITKRRDNIEAKFRVSVVGDGITSSEEYTVGTIDGYHPSAILLKGITPSSKIKIEGTYGKFYIKEMKVFAIDDAIFYESFDYMTGRETGEFYFLTDDKDKATAAMCDNSDLAVLTNIFQSRKNIYIRYKTNDRASKYVMPTVPFDAACDALLSFRIGHLEEDGNYLTVSNDDKKMAICDATGLSNYTTSHTINIDKNIHSCWLDYNIVVKNMNSSTVLTFSGYGVNLDNIKVSPLSILDETTINNSINDNPYCSVLLLRTLTANVWCPLCLPFEITKEQMEEAINTTCELCTLTGVEDDVFIFDEATTIAAGTPFIVRVPSMVENPIFTGVTITNTPAATINYDGYKFVGTYSPVDLETDGTNLFLTINGKLGCPGTGEGYNHINGLRAYFVVPNSSSSARISIGGNENVDVVKTPVKSTSQTETTTYDLQGRSVNSSLTKGLHIRNARKYLTR